MAPSLNKFTGCLKDLYLAGNSFNHLESYYFFNYFQHMKIINPLSQLYLHPFVWVFLESHRRLSLLSPNCYSDLLYYYFNALMSALLMTILVRLLSFIFQALLSFWFPHSFLRINFWSNFHYLQFVYDHPFFYLEFFYYLIFNHLLIANF